MSFLRKEPGLVFAAIFVIMGITFVAGVSVAEKLSLVAGQGYDGGIVNGAPWQATQFPPVEMN